MKTHLARWLWILIMPWTFTAAAFAAPDAGPAKTITVPVRELTLFGHSDDPLHDAIAWTLVSGPGPVHFSAPWALATSLQLTATGVYTVRLTINGTTFAETTVTLHPSESQTSFYVDPNSIFVGDGSSSRPWRDFEDGNPNQAAHWSAINQALATEDVAIFFSARRADADMPAEMTNDFTDAVVRVNRTDTSTHHLTLDGESLYNTNPVNGSWVENTGSAKMRMRMAGGCCVSIGWDNDRSYDHVTLRGFEITGSGGRVRWGGSDSTIEDFWIHDVTDLGATLQFTPAVIDGTCIPIGIDREITIRHNLLERTIGEAIYIASNYNYVEDGGCISGPFSGDNHHDFLVEANTVDEPAFYGAEGDGIDFKAGIYNVTIRGNLLKHLRGYGITTLGQMPNSTNLSNYLIEGNIIEDAPGPWYAGISPNGLKGFILRNNVIRNCKPDSYGAITQDVRAPGTPTGAGAQLFNNTIDGCGGPTFQAMDDAPVLRNNLFLSPPFITSNTGIDSDWNVFVGSLPPFTPEGPNSEVVPSADGVVVQGGEDDHLVTGSPAIGEGVNLFPAFTVDIEGSPRAMTGAWDVGAYALAPPQRVVHLSGR
jgi:hypothetical protein